MNSYYPEELNIRGINKRKLYEVIVSRPIFSRGKQEYIKYEKIFKKLVLLISS